MIKRDDFPLKVKEELAKRVAHYCSFPECESITIGPSDACTTTSSSIGMACHIAAAAEGGKRYRKDMKPSERMAIDNGIWMCYSHGKLIDTDEVRFTIELLQDWKVRAENIASLMLNNGISYQEAKKISPIKKLSPNELILSHNNEINQIIGCGLEDSCLGLMWGNDTMHTIRDFLIEYVNNSFQHGGATNVKISIQNNHLKVLDDGHPFDVQTLLNNDFTSGGSKAIKSLFGHIGEKMIYTYERIGKENIITMGFIEHPAEIPSVTPCSIVLNINEIKRGNVNVNVRETCNEIYVALPKFLSFSDLGYLERFKNDLINVRKRIVFITDGLSPNVNEEIGKIFINSKIITL